MRAMAELAADDLRGAGFGEVELIEGRFHPGVWAVLDVGAPVTLHVYAMLDTRPADSAAWRFDPWGASVASLDGHEQVVVGRGALGAKGPFLTFLNAVEALLDAGRLPVNLIVLAEGEEIMGSPSYARFVAERHDRLRGVAGSYCLGPAQAGPATVNVGLGLKGMVVAELHARGDAVPGGSNRAVHSMAASLVASPAWYLMRALASLVDVRGRPSLAPLRDWTSPRFAWPTERDLLAARAAEVTGWDPREALPLGGRDALAPTAFDAPTGLQTMLYGPTCNLAGVRAGFLGAATGTEPFSTPGRASATVDIRSVSDASAASIVAALRDHLDEHGFDAIELDVLAAFDHHRTDPDHPMVRAVTSTLEDAGYVPRVWPLEAGGGPWTAVPRALDVPCVRGGVPGGGRRGVDEYLVVRGGGGVAGALDAAVVHATALTRVAAALHGA